MGDFNAKIGLNSDIKKCVGKHLVDRLTNLNGEKMMKFVEGNNLKIPSTFLKNQSVKKWTWKAQNEQMKNEIDHLIINDTRVVINVKVLADFAFSSDHKMSRSSPKLPKRVKYLNYSKQNRTNLTNYIIPTHKQREAGELLIERIQKSNF